MFEVQTREEDGGIRHFDRLSEAFAFAERDHGCNGVWKISFPVGDGTRARFIKNHTEWGETVWKYEPIIPDQLLEVMDSDGDQENDPTP